MEIVLPNDLQPFLNLTLESLEFSFGMGSQDENGPFFRSKTECSVSSKLEFLGKVFEKVLGDRILVGDNDQDIAVGKRASKFFGRG